MNFFAIYSAIGGTVANRESLHNTTTEMNVEWEEEKYSKRTTVSLIREAFHTLQKDLAEKHRVEIDKIVISQFTLVDSVHDASKK